VSEIIGIVPGGFEVGCCNAKMRRTVKPNSAVAVLTIQAGAFPAEQTGEREKGDSPHLPERPEGCCAQMGTVPFFPPQVQKLAAEGKGALEFLGYEPAEKKEVDLAKAEIIVSAGRGTGKKDNVALIAALAKALGGELGATRPVVDAGWVEHSRQVGTTGQTVSPKLYVACGISGAIQHLAGMKKSDFVVAINKDKDAPIGEIADVLVVADVVQFVPALTAKVAPTSS
jgi:electron transfer flavoprotein alpha subunit